MTTTEKVFSRTPLIEWGSIFSMIYRIIRRDNMIVFKNNFADGIIFDSIAGSTTFYEEFILKNVMLENFKEIKSSRHAKFGLRKPTVFHTERGTNFILKTYMCLYKGNIQRTFIPSYVTYPTLDEIEMILESIVKKFNYSNKGLGSVMTMLVLYGDRVVILRKPCTAL